MTPDEFWKRPDRTDGCWYWRGAHTQNGYGIAVVNGEHTTAHRIAWQLTHGRRAPKGVDVDHVCHNAADPPCPGGVCPHRLCVRPDHLRLATRSENNAAGALGRVRTMCRYGHRKSAGACPTCARERGKRTMREHRARLRSDAGLTPARPVGERTHCPQGHVYEGANLILKGTERVCRTCKNASNRGSMERWRRRHGITARQQKAPLPH